MKVPSQHIFDRIISDQSSQPLIENNLRGIFAEYLIADLLGDEWRICDGTYAEYDLEGPCGEKVEVKSSAYLQSWWRLSVEDGKSPISKINFSIKGQKDERGQYKRPAEVYVFALHESQNTNTVDHRCPHQWGFYVCPRESLPDQQKTIGLGPLRKISTYCKAGDLSDVVSGIFAKLKTLA